MDLETPYSHPFRRANLAQRKPTRFSLAPDAEALAAIAQALGITKICRATFKGEIRPLGRTDFGLDAVLEAEVVQPCITSLEPVVTQLRENVRRHYVADWKTPEAEEYEVPEDDSQEPLGEVIDAGQVMVEAIILALPLYPRAKGAQPIDITVSAPGTEPLTEEKLKPFAGLADLLHKPDGKSSG
ncbi:MAG: DUF177 domain-containing protein [Albidovulum sp.]